MTTSLESWRVINRKGIADAFDVYVQFASFYFDYERHKAAFVLLTLR